MNDQKSGRTVRPSLVFFLCGALVACGGGSDVASTDAAAPLPAPTTNSASATTDVPALVAASTPAAPEVSNVGIAPSLAVTEPSAPATPTTALDASCGLNGAGGIQAQVLQWVNALRAAGAVCGTTIYAAAAPLNWNSLLLKAASGHASDMASNNYFSHDSLDGRTVAQRISDAGYSYSAAAENIAAGDTTVQSVLTHWLNSPGHCVNMMSATYRDIGVACARSATSTYGYYWTMNLGRP